MPFSVPTPPPSSLSSMPADSSLAPMRSQSSHSVPSYTFSNDKGPGAFASLSGLPRRGPGPSLVGNPQVTSATAKRFHIRSSSEASSDSSSDEDEGPIRHSSLADDDEMGPPALKLRINRVGSPSFNGVPFPRSSPLSSPVLGLSSPFPSPNRTPSRLSNESLSSPSRDSSTPLPLSASNPIYSPYIYSPQDGTASTLPLRPTPTRSTSSPHIVTSTGRRPLKSSLKSSSSTSSISSHSHHAGHLHSAHQRASSAPTTPGNELVYNESNLSGGDSSPSSPLDSGASSPTTPKSVHFPLPTHLERVRVFHRTAKPASLLTVRVQGEETETETETDRGSDWGYDYRGGNTTRPSFPFPKMAPSPLSESSSPSSADGAGTSESQNGSTKLELDMTGCSVPNPHSIPPASGTNILLESISLSPATEIQLQGTFIVRNLAFQKDVAVRFTMDEWSTVSEIKANWAAHLPTPFPSQQRSSVKDHDTWDRFSFSINLSDYTLPSLPSKVLYLVGRYTIPGEEYWDNCGGRNWRVKFKLVETDKAEVPSASSSKSLPNVIVSPPSASLPVASLATASSSLSSTSFPNVSESPIFSSPVPIVKPPPSGRSDAIAQATAQRLRRFSLSNYVAPGGSTPPPTAKATSPSPNKVEQEEPTGVVDNDKEQQPPSAAVTQPSPRGPLSIVTMPLSDKVRSSPSLSPSSPPSSLPTPPIDAEGRSESLYNWFVQQWCFAGMSSDTGTGPGSIPDQTWKTQDHEVHVPVPRGSLGLEIEG
jgi:hypothetical protein